MSELTNEDQDETPKKASSLFGLKPKKETELFRFQVGMNFKCKMIGVDNVPEARGDRMCQDAIQRLKAYIKNSGQHKHKVVLNVSMDGIKIIDDRTAEVLYEHSVNRISFIARDVSDARAFGYICGPGDGTHKFYAIKTDKAAEAVVLTLKELFNKVFELKKKESEESSKKLPESPASITVKTPTLSGNSEDATNNDLLDLSSLNNSLQVMGSMSSSAQWQAFEELSTPTLTGPQQQGQVIQMGGQNTSFLASQPAGFSAGQQAVLSVLGTTQPPALGQPSYVRLPAPVALQQTGYQTVGLAGAQNVQPQVIVPPHQQTAMSSGPASSGSNWAKFDAKPAAPDPFANDPFFSSAAAMFESTWGSPKKGSTSEDVWSSPTKSDSGRANGPAGFGQPPSNTAGAATGFTQSTTHADQFSNGFGHPSPSSNEFVPASSQQTASSNQFAPGFEQQPMNIGQTGFIHVSSNSSNPTATQPATSMNSANQFHPGAPGVNQSASSFNQFSTSLPMANSAQPSAQQFSLGQSSAVNPFMSSDQVEGGEVGCIAPLASFDASSSVSDSPDFTCPPTGVDRFLPTPPPKALPVAIPPPANVAIHLPSAPSPSSFPSVHMRKASPPSSSPTVYLPKAPAPSSTPAFHAPTKPPPSSSPSMHASFRTQSPSPAHVQTLPIFAFSRAVNVPTPSPDSSSPPVHIPPPKLVFPTGPPPPPPPRTRIKAAATNWESFDVVSSAAVSDSWASFDNNPPAYPPPPPPPSHKDLFDMPVVRNTPPFRTVTPQSIAGSDIPDPFTNVDPFSNINPFADDPFALKDPLQSPLEEGEFKTKVIAQHDPFDMSVKMTKTLVSVRESSLHTVGGSGFTDIAPSTDRAVRPTDTWVASDTWEKSTQPPVKEDNWFAAFQHSSNPFSDCSQMPTATQGTSDQYSSLLDL